jgi:oligopeptide/dipeptide ABC transporter ATP-binding protein
VTGTESPEPLLELRDLAVEFATPAGLLRAVDGVNLVLRPGECLGVVGESGAGKSQLFLACLGLLPRNAHLSGSLRLCGQELARASETQWRAVRGRTIATVFQDPMNALTPHLRIGMQLREALEATGQPVSDAREQSLAALRRVGIDEPERRLGQFPHEFSGGMRQRVAIAMALLGRPQVLVADEPTTALDVSVQARILELLHEALADGLSLVLVSHDLGVVASLADRIAVMYAGRIVEQADTAALLAQPRHPYTQALLDAVPRLDGPREARLRTIEGAPPAALQRPLGCAFAPRCPRRVAVCEAVLPAWTALGAQSGVACHLAAGQGGR